MIYRLNLVNSANLKILSQPERIVNDAFLPFERSDHLRVSNRL
jgi:hypothetical protein